MAMLGTSETDDLHHSFFKWAEQSCGAQVGSSCGLSLSSSGLLVKFGTWRVSAVRNSSRLVWASPLMVFCFPSFSPFTSVPFSILACNHWAACNHHLIQSPPPSSHTLSLVHFTPGYMLYVLLHSWIPYISSYYRDRPSAASFSISSALCILSLPLVATTRLDSSTDSQRSASHPLLFPLVIPPIHLYIVYLSYYRWYRTGFHVSKCA